MAIHTYRYGPEDDHVGDLWLPEGNGPFPVLVVLHGGYWRAYYKKDLMDGVCADLARRGWAAWNLEYRRLGAGGGWPATFRDVATGVDFLDLLAERHPLDLQRFGALGHSAGGQLALWTAARRALPPVAPGAGPVINPAFVVDLAGVSDLRLAEQLEQGSHASAELLGGTPDNQPGRYELASPTERIPLNVPTAVVHGTADTSVAPEISTSYVDKAREAGDRVELITVPDADHFDLIDPESAAWAQAADQLTRLVPKR